MENKDIELAAFCLQTAREKGALKARVTFSRSTEDLVATLNGEIDRVTHCSDCSISIALFVDGRFGSFSTNRMDRDSLEQFIDKSVNMVRMLAADEFRDLPDPSRTAKDAVKGDEMKLYDPRYSEISPSFRKETALKCSVFPSPGLVSEEGEYSDSIFETYVADTNGLSCLHTETSFDYGVEVTIEDADGEKYSGYWWTASPMLSNFHPEDCGRIALEKARAQTGSEPAESGKYNMVIDSEVSSKMVSPILKAINAYSLQQKNSFLTDSLGKKLFPEGMTIIDDGRLEGQAGSKLFDSEGVATVCDTIIDRGVISKYFVNTYMSGKTGLEPTIEEATRPHLLPWPKKGLTRENILGMCGDGILVTDFNGGNSNTATGNFSYGIEGFLFKDGKIVRPVSGMLVTGNFLSLWDGLIACGDDNRTCKSKLIPTLAFSNVDFSG